MNKKLFWISLLAVIISFVGGFLLANALNRRDLEDLRAENGRLKIAPPPVEEDNAQSNLSDEEIRRRIAEADQNSGNIEYQKNLAVALYRYASMKQDSKWLPDIARLLTRAVEKNPKDYNSLISLGDVYFDIAQNAANSGQTDNQNKGIEQSREFYRRALAINPDDAQLQTDYGATFLFAKPSEDDKAIAAFQKSLQTNPDGEKTLEFMTKALLNKGKSAEAKNYFDKLKQLNPKNETLPELEAKFSVSN